MVGGPPTKRRLPDLPCGDRVAWYKPATDLDSGREVHMGSEPLDAHLAIEYLDGQPTSLQVARRQTIEPSIQ
jgi:hypothetical protein